jgi:hypothetical protein
MRIASVTWLLPVALATCAWAQETAVSVRVEHHFPAVGIVPGQTIRITVLNPIRNPAPEGMLAVPCQVAVRVFDSGGQVLKEEKIDDIERGTAKWLDYSPQVSILVFPPPRFTVAALVQLAARMPSIGLEGTTEVVRIAPCSVIPTLEVFDNSTNKTVFVVSGPGLNAPIQNTVRAVARYADGVLQEAPPEVQSGQESLRRY